MKDVTGIIVLVSIGCSMIGIGYAVFLAMWVLKRDEGNATMKSIAHAIQEGARAYLNRQYRTVAVVAVAIFAVLWIAGMWSDAFGLLTAVGFLVGASASALAGYVGMHMAVRANVRTAHAAHDGLGPALRVAFRGGGGDWPVVDRARSAFGSRILCCGGDDRRRGRCRSCAYQFRVRWQPDQCIRQGRRRNFH